MFVKRLVINNVLWWHGISVYLDLHLEHIRWGIQPKINKNQLNIINNDDIHCINLF